MEYFLWYFFINTLCAMVVCVFLAFVLRKDPEKNILTFQDAFVFLSIGWFVLLYIIFKILKELLGFKRRSKNV